MILISGSSEREIVDLQQGDYEEMDQLAIAKPLCKAAFRVLHAADIGIGLARAIRAAVSGRPGGVYLDLPAKLFSQVMNADAGTKSLVKVIDPAPAQIPAPGAVKRALDVLKNAKRPLIILGKGAAYAQADDAIRALIEKSAIPFLPMSMCIVVFNNNGIYRGTDVNPTGGSDVATTVFVKDSRYDKMMEAFGGVGVNATTPDELKRAVNEAMDSGKPTLINAMIDPASGSESGRIGNLNPQSMLRKK
jgi:thiamine pyrophosphate-dependent acetolactate synthase large subunit-like protein